MKGIIYKATSNFEGKVYIGQTITSLRHRKGEHEKDAKSVHDWNYFHTALFQQNFDFDWEVIDTFEGDAEFVHHALNVAEEYHILKHRSADDRYGYNSTYGGYSSDKYANHYKAKMAGSGAPKSFWQYDLDGNFIREWRSLREIADAFNLPKLQAKKLCGQWRGFQWRPKVGNSPKPIAKYEMPVRCTVGVAMYGSDGGFIKTFSRRVDAEKEYGRGFALRDDFSKAVVLPYRLRDSRLFFRVPDDGKCPDTIAVTILPQPIEKEKSIVVLHKYDAYDLNGNFIARYNSQFEARKATGMCSSAIRFSCRRDEPIQISWDTKMLWRYGDGEIRERIDVIPYISKVKPEPKMEHRVLQYSLQGDYISTFENSLQASKITGDSNSFIRNLCEGYIPKKCPKYQWRRYTDDDPLNIGPIKLAPRKTPVSKRRGTRSHFGKSVSPSGQVTLF